MNRKNLVTFLLAAVLIDFLALTGYAMWNLGLVGIIEAASANAGTILLSVDLVLALGVACFWMWGDAKQRGETALPYILLTAATGSAGPLAYLIKRSRAAT